MNNFSRSISHKDWLSFARTISMILMIVLMISSADARDKYLTKSEEYNQLAKIAGVEDQARGIHNASNIGLLFENRGILYPRASSWGPSGEFPINSDRNYIWRMNPLVGVAPDAVSGRESNVIQSIWVANREWQAVGGYHKAGTTDIAFSDAPATWPGMDWLVQSDANDPLIFSTQDSYCVYRDSDNTVEVLDIQIAQTGYAYGLPFAEDLLFFIYEITNQSTNTYDSVYFGIYMDYDVGDSPGGASEWEDDMFKFDAANNFVMAYDALHFSTDWDDSTGMMGVTLLETPFIHGSMAGITDMHYNFYADDHDDDDLQMAILSSNLDYLPTGLDSRDYFHPGVAGNLQKDDTDILDPDGDDYMITISSGPFDLTPSDTLRFISCIVAGNNEEDLYRNLYAAQGLYSTNFVAPKPPPSPTLSGVAGHNEITLYWTNELENEFDEISGAQDFEGYRLYKSIDHGLTWDQLDRNIVPDIGLEPIPFTSFDRINGWGDDKGLQYTYVDDNLIDGVEYWYSITAFDHGDSLIGSLEAPIGNSVDARNVISIRPVSESVAYVAGDVSNLNHYGGGNSNYNLKITPATSEQLGQFTYDLHFLYAIQNEIGNSGIGATIEIIDSILVSTIHYGILFTAENQISIINNDTKTVYWSGPLGFEVPYPFGSAFSVFFHQIDTLNLPSYGDLLSLNFCAELLRFDGLDTTQVIAPQRFDPGMNLVSDDGLILSFTPQDEIQNINVPPILDFEVEIEVADLDSIQDMDYQLTITNSGVDTDNNTFIVLRTTDENATVIGAADTLYHGWGIQYRGWTAWFEFDAANPPPAGTTTTFSTLPAIRPTIQDYYQFGIVDAHTNPDQLADELSEIRVVPNPYMAGSLWESEHGSFVREPVRQIQFTNLPVECEINIFTLSGDLIKTLEHDATHGTETWDLRAEGGREIVSGIYLYQVKSAGKEYLNRFAVIK